MADISSIITRVAKAAHNQPVAAAATVIAVGGAALLAAKLAGRSKPAKAAANSVTIELLDLESTSLMMMVPSVSTVTFFDGDASSAETYLRDRLAAVVGLNPWLEGTLARGGPRNHVCLTYEMRDSATPKPLAPSTFAVVDDPAVEETVPYADLTRRLAPYTVADGGACLSGQSPLFRVTLIRISPSRYAVAFSLSHVIADGHTFYNLYGMLGLAQGSSEPARHTPRALIVERHHGYFRDLEDVMGGNDTFTWLSSAWTKVSIIRTVLFGARPRVLVAPVSPAWLEQQKEAGKGNGVPFVSTNDIVTSAVLRMTRPDVGIMAVNFRGRLLHLTDQHSGNYEGLVAYQPQDFATPGVLRQSLGHGRVRRAHGDQPLPGPRRAMSARVSVVSTWVTFYCDLALPGAKQSLHLPLLDTVNVPFTDISIIFRPGSGRINVLSLTRTLASTQQLVDGLSGTGSQDA